MGHVTDELVAPTARWARAAGAASHIQGEQLEANERLVIAPRGGVFEPIAGLVTGLRIQTGQVVGHLTSGVERTPVVSPFAGLTGAPLALAGERLCAHQPVMWLSADAGRP